MKCLKCQEPLSSLTLEKCPKCGTKVDADGDGVPDALGVAIEEKAKALLATEKQREKDAAQRSADDIATRVAETALRSDQVLLASLKSDIEKNQQTPRSSWHFSKGTLVLFSIVSFIIGGLIMPGCVEPIAGQTILAGRLFCPSKCSTCRGPGRVFTWHTSGGGYEGNVSMQLCHSALRDIDKVTWMDVNDDDDLPVAPPDKLTMWTSVPVDFVLTLAFFLLVGPFVVARWRRRWLDESLVKLTKESTTTETRLRDAARGAGKNDEAPPYR